MIKKGKHLALVFALTVLAGNVPSKCANASKAAPTKDGLVMLETSAYHTWKSKDAMFWDSFLSGKFVGYGSVGKLDKASATREFRGVGCEIQSFTLSMSR